MYQPVERRKEVTREKQRDMELAFERLFVKSHGKIFVIVFNLKNCSSCPLEWLMYNVAIDQ